MKRVFAAAIFLLVFFSLNAFSGIVTDRVFEICDVVEDKWNFNPPQNYEEPGYSYNGSYGERGEMSPYGLGKYIFSDTYSYHFFKEQGNPNWQGDGGFSHVGNDFGGPETSVGLYLNWERKFVVDGKRIDSESFDVNESQRLFPFLRESFPTFFGGKIRNIPNIYNPELLGTFFYLIPNPKWPNYQCLQSWMDYGDGRGEVPYGPYVCPEYDYEPPLQVEVVCPRVCDRYPIDFAGDLGVYGLFQNKGFQIIDDEYNPCVGVTVTEYDITCEGAPPLPVKEGGPLDSWQIASGYNFRVEGVCDACGNGYRDKFCEKGDMFEGAPCTSDGERYIPGSCEGGEQACKYNDYEQCDDGNGRWDDGCSPLCILDDTRKCGNGILDSDEQCEIFNPCPNRQACTLNCQCGAVCGNGIPEIGEDCDDGIVDPDDTHLNGSADDDGICVIDVERRPESCKTNSCGDGYLDQRVEECDDWNNSDGDGCSASCEIEEGPVCGDGNIEPPEQCEQNSDCSSGNVCQNCKCVEEEFCGNGNPDPGEQCDDGVDTDTYYTENKADDDGMCVIDGQKMQVSCMDNFCGDGYLFGSREGGSEKCDDGSHCEDGSVCENDVECAGIGGGLCLPRDNDGCSASCVIEYCGDRIIQPPREQCEATPDCGPFGGDLVCFQCQCVEELDDYYQLGISSESVYGLGNPLVATYNLDRTVSDGQVTTKLHYYISNLKGEIIGGETAKDITFLNGETGFLHLWNDLQLSSENGFQPGTYILFGRVEPFDGEKFTANNHASKYITITSQEVQVNIPETNLLLVVVSALAVVFIVRRKK
ncbi:MAG: hypothetical protein Q7K34_01965 [archaeon]|nr:hypothetical protein [archaeon]